MALTYTERNFELEVQQAKQVPVIDLMARTGFAAQRIGSTHTIKCPLHGETGTPSLRIYPETNTWFCFGSGCEKGGDNIQWIMDLNKLSFRDAVAWILNEFGSLQFVEKTPEAPEVKIYLPSDRVTGMAYYWHQCLGPSGREFFHARGFSDETIDQQMFGWSGSRYSIPVWAWVPGNSRVVTIRLRKPESDTTSSPKYISLANTPTDYIWGLYHSQHEYAFLFAGELDGAFAVQDRLSASSLVSGVRNFHSLPTDWPTRWYPKTRFLFVVFDEKEEPVAGRVCGHWNKHKEPFSAQIIHYDPALRVKDYNQLRLKYSLDIFLDMVYTQIGDKCVIRPRENANIYGFE